MSTTIQSIPNHIPNNPLATALPIPNHFLNQAIVHSTSGIVVVDVMQADRPLIYVNVGFEKMTGYRREEVLGKNCRFLQGKDTDQSAIAQLKQAVQEQKECRITLLNYKKDHTPFWNELNITPIYDEGGKLCYFMGSQKDVTAQMRANIALKRSQNRINAIIESSLDAVISIDSKSRIIEWNSTATNIFGWSASETLNKDLLEIIVPLQLQQSYRKEKQLFLTTGHSQLLGTRMETVARRKNGELFPVEMSIVPIQMENGYIFNAFIRDITFQKEVEQKQINLVAKLEDAIKELEMFSYSVSHDLRAPLRHIAGYANLLQKNSKQVLDIKGERYLQTITEAAKSMGVLIDELLVFSRMGRATMRTKTLALHPIIEQVLYILEFSHKDRNIQFNISELPPIPGDATMITQVFQNLLSNAIKYSRHKSLAVIEVGYKDQEEHVCFWVKDNGAGFDMKYQHKLFGVFQRLHTQDEFEGVGIGLANVKRIIKRHGGEIWAEAKPDQGATFFFTLPK